MRVLLFSRSLNAGGAERQLAQLAQALHRKGVPVAVAVFYGDGPWRQFLDEAGVEVIDLAKTGRWDVVRFLWRACQRLRAWRPDVIYCFIGTGLLATLMKFVLPGIRLVWSVRASNLDMSHYDWLMRLMDKASLWALRGANAIISNSDAGRLHLLEKQVDDTAVTVIVNGIDTDQYRFDPALRGRQRQAWGVDDTERLVGLVARIDPIKDHATFIAAAHLAAARQPNLRFACVGGGDILLECALKAQASKSGISDRLIWAGHCSDLAAVYSALDVLVLSSTSEGFPNVIGEGMACGLPVVATDVGDCRKIVANHGWIVPPGAPASLSDAIITACAALDGWDRSAPRRRIAESYGVDAMVAATIGVLEGTSARFESTTS